MDKSGSMKIIIVCIAVVIALASLVVSQFLIDDMKEEERKKMEIWASAMQIMSNADSNADMTLVLKVLNGNNTIPVVVLDDEGMVQDWRNLDLGRTDSLASLHRQVARICAGGKNIRFYLNDNEGNVDHTQFVDVYYDDSLLLRRLAMYPYVQLGVVVIFVVIAALLLTNMKRAEQNRVWVGLSKETAHQLGTPISSLMAWHDLLSEQHPGDEAVAEMGKDIEVVSHSLFEWVIENLCKNAADAMDGSGKITLTHGKTDGKVWVEVADEGKGIPKSKFKTVFNPGYTTKKRGWGLGLSLSRRIIKDYHKGRIFVKSSELGVGTTFRIELKDVRV